MIYNMISYCNMTMVLYDIMVTVAGEEKAWAVVPKFHDLRHMIAPIARWGCIENSSGN